MIGGLLRGRNLALDIGTSNTAIYVAGKGLALLEPSVVAVGAGRDGGRRILAVGEEASRMAGRTHDAIQVIRPLQGGVIADLDAASALVRHLAAKATGRRRFAMKRVLVGAPLGATSVERQAFATAARGLGASRTEVLAGPLAAAIGAGLPVSEPSASMVVDIGGGMTEAAVISLGGVVVSASLRCGGDDFDEAIQRRVRRRRRLAASLLECERAKIAVNSADDAWNGNIEMRGHDMSSGLPRALHVCAEDVHAAMAEPVESIVALVHGVVERCPPELAADLVNDGLLLTGGGALLRGMRRLLENRLRVPVRLPADPLSCAACGLGEALEDLDFQAS